MKWQLALAYLPFLGLGLFAPASSISQQPGGLQPGAKAPAFTLSDQAGKKTGSGYTGRPQRLAAAILPLRRLVPLL